MKTKFDADELNLMTLAQQYPLKSYKRHDVGSHAKHEYHRRNTDATPSGVNRCGSFFSLLKLGVIGGWHHISREHPAKYTSEIAFRWNIRKMTDGSRLVAAEATISGKRLRYRQAV